MQLPTTLLILVVATAAHAQTSTAAVAPGPAPDHVRGRELQDVGNDVTRSRRPMPGIVVTETLQAPSTGSDFGDDVDPQPRTPYEAARQAALQGEWDEAEALVRSILPSDPDNRDLHRLFAEIAYYKYKDLDQVDALDTVAVHGARALELSVRGGVLDLRAADLLADAAGAVKDRKMLDRLFADAARLDNSGHIELAHARALMTLGSPLAEIDLRHAASLATDGNTEAVEEYAAWLLDQGRPNDVVALLARFERTNPYVNFLRGVALDRTGNATDATVEYAKYASFSAEYPAPRRFRLSDSAAQAAAGLHFRGEPRLGVDAEASAIQSGRVTTNAVSSSQAQQGLSYLIYGEAVGESVGGKRAEGWVVRNRALRGNIYNDAGTTCPYVTNSGSTLSDQYKSVMCQSGQFDGMCVAWCSNPSTTTCKETADTKAVAGDVYNGYAPDPVGAHCPSGFSKYGAFCDSATRCLGSTTDYRLAGGVFNYAKASGVACPSLCSGTGVGKTCGNGGYDNCFYPSAKYARTGLYTYSATFTAVGQNGYTAAFSGNAGMQKGHLEGPENSANPDFDLYLEKSCGTGCWTTVASATRVATVEDLSYTSSGAATYRWRIYAYKGTGSFQLYTVRP